MSRPISDSSQHIGECARFQQTLWGQVFAAGRQGLPESQEAMAKLYQAYWLPIYSFLRRSGKDYQTARDLAQDFFGYLWEHNLVAKADPNLGKFRSFLLGVLKKFVLSRHEKQNTVKRGAEYQFLSIDVESAEGIYANEPRTNETPETIFERYWALKVVEQASERLQAQYAKEGLNEEFSAIKPFLTGENDVGYAALAKELSKSEASVRTSVCRLRGRFRALILEVISDTLVDKEAAEAEFAHLAAALRGISAS